MSVRTDNSRARDFDDVPQWLWAAVWASAAVVGCLLAWEVLVLRPGYGVGDETQQVRLLVGVDLGRPLPWLWAQGSVQRAGLWLWLRCVGNGLRALHIPGLAVLGLEVVLLWRLARRWFSNEVAAWAVLCDLLCAATWMRTRGILSYQWLHLELLILALSAGKVRNAGTALIWGAAGGLLLLDYEGALAALPGLYLACLWQEREFRRHCIAAGVGLLGAGFLLASLQMQVVGDYVRLRSAVNWGEGLGAVSKAWARNLGQLLVGGMPLPYLGVDAWPAVAAWSLPLLGLGAWTAWTSGARSLLVWALLAVLVTQAATAPWGVPSQRLVAAWPALCLLVGLGGERLRRRWARVPGLVWVAFLMLGLTAEANAFYRHMAFHGRQIYGRAQLLESAARDARSAAAGGAAVCTALMETATTDLRFFVAPSPGSPVGEARAWVFLPPEFRVAAEGAGRALVYRSSHNDVPILVLLAQGPQAVRFESVETELRSLLGSNPAGTEVYDPASIAREGVWLADDPARRDSWAYAAVLDRYLRRLWVGLRFDRGVLKLVSARAPVTPGPLCVLGNYMLSRDPAIALLFLDRALSLDPLWGPALQDRVEAFRAEGKDAAARNAQALFDLRVSQGAWRTYR